MTGHFVAVAEVAKMKEVEYVMGGWIIAFLTDMV